MRDHVMGVRAVTGRAEVIRSGGRVLKNVTGLDLCKLLTGSHGTLGVITEITLKVLPAPEATGTLVLPDLDANRRRCGPVRRPGLAVRRLWRRLAAGGRRRPRVRPRSRPWLGHADPHRGFLTVGHLPHRPAEGSVRGDRRGDARHRGLARPLEGYPRCPPLDRRSRRTPSGASRSGRLPALRC